MGETTGEWAEAIERGIETKTTEIKVEQGQVKEN